MEEPRTLQKTTSTEGGLKEELPEGSTDSKILNLIESLDDDDEGTVISAAKKLMSKVPKDNSLDVLRKVRFKLDQKPSKKVIVSLLRLCGSLDIEELAWDEILLLVMLAQHRSWTVRAEVASLIGYQAEKGWLTYYYPWYLDEMLDDDRTVVPALSALTNLAAFNVTSDSCIPHIVRILKGKERKLRTTALDMLSAIVMNHMAVHALTEEEGQEIKEWIKRIAQDRQKMADEGHDLEDVFDQELEEFPKQDPEMHRTGTTVNGIRMVCPVLYELVDDASGEVSKAAVRLIKLMTEGDLLPPGDGLQALDLALLNDDPEVRKMALDGLCHEVVRINSTEVIDHIARSFTDPDPVIRTIAARAIGNFLNRGSMTLSSRTLVRDEDQEGRLFDSIEPLINDPDPRVRKEIAYLTYNLVLQGFGHIDTIAAMVELLKDGDVETTESALLSIKELAEREVCLYESLEPVSKFIKDDDDEFLGTAMAIMAYNAMHCSYVLKSKTPRYMELLKHEDHDVVEAAVFILGAIAEDGVSDERGESILEAVMDLLINGSTDHTRSILYVLYELADGGIWSEKVVQPLLELSAEESDPFLMSDAYQALNRMAEEGCPIDELELEKRRLAYNLVMAEIEEKDDLSEDGSGQ